MTFEGFRDLTMMMMMMMDGWMGVWLAEEVC